MHEVLAIETDKQRVVLAEAAPLSYDYLVVAPGSRHFYYGHPQWERYAPGLKTLRDALTIREKILLAFEKAEASADPLQQNRFLTFVVVGGGPTGVEMAGAIAEIAQQTMVKNFRVINTKKTKVYLIEAGPRILAGFPESLSLSAQTALTTMGVEVLTRTAVTEVGEDFVEIGPRRLATATIIWAAGNIVAPLLKSLSAPQDQQGRILVAADLSLPARPEVFVLGDAASVKNARGEVLPGMAPIAIQQGRYIAGLLRAEARGVPRKPFVYHERGAMATIGKAKAIVWVGRLRFAGFFAWLFWCVVHIAFLIGFRNRFFVMLEWSFWYITGKRSSRLIYYRDERSGT
jgi:NADH dehydrogenase